MLNEIFQILPHISLSLAKWPEIQHRRSKYIKFGIKMKKIITFFRVIWTRDTLEVPSQH